jgi:hypothetical protein
VVHLGKTANLYSCYLSTAGPFLSFERL